MTDWRNFFWIFSIFIKKKFRFFLCSKNRKTYPKKNIQINPKKKNPKKSDFFGFIWIFFLDIFRWTSPKCLFTFPCQILGGFFCYILYEGTQVCKQYCADLDFGHVVLMVDSDQGPSSSRGQTSGTTRGASRWHQSISSARRLIEFDHVLLESGSPCHSTCAQISANQEKDDGHIEDNDNLKAVKKHRGNHLLRGNQFRYRQSSVI